MVFKRLETARLILRHFHDDDLAPFMEYRNDPEVARYQGWESISTTLAQAFIQEQKDLEPGISGKPFQFAVELKESELLIGDCMLSVNVQDPQQAELGVTFSRAYQRRGLATEAVATLLDYAFSKLDLHRVFATVDAENKPSAALMRRVGLRQEGHFLKNAWFKGHWSDEFLFAVLQAEWLPGRGRSPS